LYIEQQLYRTQIYKTKTDSKKIKENAAMNKGKKLKENYNFMVSVSLTFFRDKESKNKGPPLTQRHWSKALLTVLH